MIKNILLFFVFVCLVSVSYGQKRPWEGGGTGHPANIDSSTFAFSFNAYTLDENSDKLTSYVIFDKKQKEIMKILLINYPDENKIEINATTYTYHENQDTINKSKDSIDKAGILYYLSAPIS